MSTAKFRNVEADPSAPVITWPTEGVMAALERGDIDDWSQLAAAVRADFAEAAGTSTSRLSTYLNAKVTPSATMLVRMERVAARRSRAQRTR